MRNARCSCDSAGRFCAIARVELADTASRHQGAAEAGVQLLGSCRPGARRLSRGYPLVLSTLVDQINRPVRRLDLDVKVPLVPRKIINLLANCCDIERSHEPDL